MNTPTVEFGNWVKVAGLMPGVETIIRFVCDREVDYTAHKVPRNSLLGEALFGARVGARVLLNHAHDPKELSILALGPA